MIFFNNENILNQKVLNFYSKFVIFKHYWAGFVGMNFHRIEGHINEQLSILLNEKYLER